MSFSNKDSPLRDLPYLVLVHKMAYLINDNRDLCQAWWKTTKAFHCCRTESLGPLFVLDFEWNVHV